MNQFNFDEAASSTALNRRHRQGVSWFQLFSATFLGTLLAMITMLAITFFSIRYYVKRGIEDFQNQVLQEKAEHRHKMP